MADIRGVSGMGCNDKCGCTVPCPGGVSCRCSSKDSTASGGEHKTCTCGQHCGCNPCSCPESAAAGGTEVPLLVFHIRMGEHKQMPQMHIDSSLAIF
uniref:Uncharacterized protein n=1 Tax=Quercus lobata TaxID=97700 RepID=A0A7N2L4K8_QUELO